MENYLVLNGIKIELTPEQLEQLKSGIKQPVDFSEYNKSDWFYYKLNNGNEWLSKNAFEDAHSFVLFNGSECFKNKLYVEGLLCEKCQVIEFRKPTEDEMKTLYRHYPQYKPKPQWEDFGEIKGYYINHNSVIFSHESRQSSYHDKNAFPTEAEAEACLALSQLCQWRDKYNKGWKPDWTNNELKHTIHFFRDSISRDYYTTTSRVLSFRDPEIRNKFMDDFRDLIEIAKPLL